MKNLSVIRKPLALNIENVADSEAFSASYLPTPQALRFVEETAAAALAGGGAHSLKGAYGAGKSSLAFFMMRQLCAASQNIKPQTAAGKNSQQIRKKGGLLGIAVVGASCPLANRLVAGFRRAADLYIGSAPAALRKLAGLREKEINHESVLALIKELAAELRKNKKAGLLLVVDEFGRHLDYVASSGNGEDIALLQDLAEVAQNNNSSISVVIIQHYGLTHYTRRLSSAQQGEWEKLRGRFMETDLANGETTSARIMASVFKCGGAPSKNDLLKKFSQWHKDAKTPLLGDKQFCHAAAACYPLHPLAIVALTRLSRLLGQNDRTVIGWLTAAAASGFAAAAEKSSDGWVYPAALYDHFFGDSPDLPSNPVLARRAANIATTRARFDGDENSLNLLKTVSILNFVGGNGIAANEEILKACLPPRFPLSKALANLKAQSAVVYRKHRGEYCVWQGSDYDIVGEVNSALKNLPPLRAETELNERAFAPEVAARRHYVRTGNFRKLPVLFLGKGASIPENADKKPRVLVWCNNGKLPRLPDAPNHDALAAIDVSVVVPFLKEARAISHLLESDERLREDNIARAELSEQLVFVNKRIAAYVRRFFAQEKNWHVGKNKFSSLQEAASCAVKNAYPKEFSLRNELLNRDKYGAAITGALRRLAHRMFEHEDKENFGIEKLPPEKMICLSLARGKGFHVANGGGFYLRFDPKHVGGEMRPVVEYICRHFFTAKDGKARNVGELLEAIAKPPFGVKRGPGQALLLIFLMAHKNNLELYENDRFVPDWGPATLERYMFAADNFSLAVSCRQNVTDATLKDYLFAVAPKKAVAATVVNVTRNLLLRYNNLTTFATQTGRVSKNAKNYRRAIVAAKSPSDLLFRAAPAALGVGDAFASPTKTKKFLQKLDSVLHELDNVYEGLIADFGKIVLSHYGVGSYAKARVRATEEARIVARDSRMFHAHFAFAEAIFDETEDDQKWLLKILSDGLEIGASPDKWSDADVGFAEFALRHKLLWLRDAKNAIRQHGKSYLVGASPFAVVFNQARKRPVQIQRDFFAYERNPP